MDKKRFFYYNSDTMHRLQLKIHGQVQGIFYRDTACQKAKELSVTGWVKNSPDGTVEIVAEGKEDSLKELLEWCRKGPELAEVVKVEKKWNNILEKSFEDFSIIF